jgi:hypothetical protein
VTRAGASPDRTAPARKEPRDAVMQRVRVGLTGLAAVFLLTLLAASIYNMLGQDEHSGRTATGRAIANTEDSPKEPLAELGMAPGNAPKTPATNQAGPAVTVSPPAPHGAGLAPAVSPTRH